MNIRNQIKIVALLGALFSTAPAIAQVTPPNGGAGTVRNGVYMSFYSAGLYVEPTNSDSSNTRVPGLDELTGFIVKQDFLDPNSKSALLNAIIPTNNRKYYVASPEQLTPEIEARLIAEFTRVTQLDTSSISLMAITDTKTQNTFLLPKFFQLSASDQVAILFHEAYWLMHPKSKYNNVVQAEMAFQAVYENSSDFARVYDLLGYVGSPDKRGLIAKNWDLNSGSLDGFLHDGHQFTLLELFGNDFDACQSKNKDRFDDMFSYACLPLAKLNLYQLKLKFPKSMILKKISSDFDENEFNATVFIKLSHYHNFFSDRNGDNIRGWNQNKFYLINLDDPKLDLETSL